MENKKSFYAQIVDLYNHYMLWFTVTKLPGDAFIFIIQGKNKFSSRIPHIIFYVLVKCTYNGLKTEALLSCQMNNTKTAFVFCLTFLSRNMYEGFFLSHIPLESKFKFLMYLEFKRNFTDVDSQENVDNQKFIQKLIISIVNITIQTLLSKLYTKCL